MKRFDIAGMFLGGLLLGLFPLMAVVGGYLFCLFFTL